MASRSKLPAVARTGPPFVAETQKWFDQNCTSRSTYPVSAAATFLKRTSASARNSCCGTGCSALAFGSDVVLPCATSRGAAGSDADGSGLAGVGGTSSRPPVASGCVGSFWRISWMRWRSANKACSASREESRDVSLTSATCGWSSSTLSRPRGSPATAARSAPAPRAPQPKRFSASRAYLGSDFITTATLRLSGQNGAGVIGPSNLHARLGGHAAPSETRC